MSAIFVTATGTDVGKTFLSCGLIRHLRAHGRDVGALKPVVSGFDPAHPDANDGGSLLAALDLPPTLEAVAGISPWRFAAPLSPDMAARRENRAIDFSALIAFCNSRIAGPDPLLIEGVGGLMVPLDDRHTVLDWISALDIPVLLTSGSYLGALSHTLTALDVLASHRRAVAAVVVNESPDSTVSLDETIDTLRRFAPGVDILPLPRLAAGGDHPAFARIAAKVFAGCAIQT
jgi:dethiobiotin synthetase